MKLSKKLLKARVAKLLIFLVLPTAVVASIIFKLPFQEGEYRVLTRGYGVQTHVGKDVYALDFALDGCDSWNRPVVAFMGGTVSKVDTGHKHGEKNSYGNQVLIEHEDNLVSRYAHLNEVLVDVGNEIKQGEILGREGNTGSVWGSACKEHPGTHLHFVVYKRDDFGNLAPYKPEPMSGYQNFTPGKWYQSDNKIQEENKEEPTEPPQTKPQKNPSFFEKIKDFFKDIFYGDDNEVETEVEEEIVSEENDLGDSLEKTYNVSILNTPASAEVDKDTAEYQVVVKIKNTSDITIKKEEFSVNIVGEPYQYTDYYHPSWLTKRRPAHLDQSEIEPGQNGTFSFLISVPPEPGKHNFQLQIVRQEGSQFFQVGGQFFDLNIQKQEEQKIEEENVEEVLGEKIYQEESEGVVEKAKEIIEDVSDTVEEIIEDFVEVLPPFFYGGGSSQTEGSENVEEQEEDAVEDDNPEDSIPHITITNPAGLEVFTNNQILTIEGTRSAEDVDIYINGVPNSVSFSSGTNWSTEMNLEEGENIFEIWGEDSDENKTAVFSFLVVLDTTSPTVPTIDIIQTNFVTPTLQVSWSSTDDGVGVSSYDVEYKIGNEDWSSLFLHTTTTESEIQVEQQQEYFFRARARDVLENISEWSGDEDSVFFADWTKDVVINEVAWMGTSAVKNLSNDCTKNEWLELYNGTAENINLDSWALGILSPNGDVQTIELSGSILPEDYYLIVRKLGKRQALKNIEIGQIFESIDIPNNGGSLVLKDESGNIIDEVDFSTGWPGGSVSSGPNNNFYQPMSRVSPNAPGSLSSNWGTSSHLSMFGSTDNCGELFGSPGKKNNQLWLLKNLPFYYADFFENGEMVLEEKHSPYVLDYGTEVPVGKMMKINPGVTVVGAGPDAYLRVTGDLSVNGTSEKPVVFTSARDLDYGDWNLPNFDQEDPRPGDWSRIEVEEGGSIHIDHAEFLYGGYPFKKGNDWVYGLKELSQVIRVSSANADISNSKFLYNYEYDLEPYYNSVVWVDTQKGEPSIIDFDNNIFDSGYVAINLWGQNNGLEINSTITNNIIQNFSSPEGPLKFIHNSPTLIDNTFLNNIFDGISGGHILVSDAQTMDPSFSHIYDEIEILDSGSLIIPAGTELYIRVGGGIINSGFLNFSGTNIAPINISGYGGSWGNMTTDGGVLSANYLNMKGGSGAEGMLILENQSVANIENSQLMDSSRPGIILQSTGSEINLKNTTVGWSTPLAADAPDSWTTTGIEMFGGSLSLDNVTLQEMTNGIIGYDGAIATMINMSSSSFINISELDWWPDDLL